MATEANLQNRATRFLIREGAWVLNVHGSGYMRRGIPDVLFCYLRMFGAIEFKAGSNKPTPLQARELQKIHEAGGFVTVARSLADVEDLLARMRATREWSART